MNHDTSVNNYHLGNSNFRTSITTLERFRDRNIDRVQLGRPNALYSNIAAEKSSGRKKTLNMSKVVVRKDHDLGLLQSTDNNNSLNFCV